MLKDLDKTKLPITIGGVNMYLRYNLTAMRYLEEYYDNVNEIMSRHIEQMSTVDILHLLRAGLIDCYFDKNREYIDTGNFTKVFPTLAELGRLIDQDGAVDIAMQIVQALVQSLPEPVVGEVKKKKTAQA